MLGGSICQLLCFFIISRSAVENFQLVYIESDDNGNNANSPKRSRIESENPVLVSGYAIETIYESTECLYHRNICANVPKQIRPQSLNDKNEQTESKMITLMIDFVSNSLYMLVLYENQQYKQAKEANKNAVYALKLFNHEISNKNKTIFHSTLFYHSLNKRILYFTQFHSIFELFDDNFVAIEVSEEIEKKKELFLSRLEKFSITVFRYFAEEHKPNLDLPLSHN
ncbi:hypothetical protein EDEG_04132, partial [Edhazardia aedis USNM 41457]